MKWLFKLFIRGVCLQAESILSIVILSWIYCFYIKLDWLFKWGILMSLSWASPTCVVHVFQCSIVICISSINKYCWAWTWTGSFRIISSCFAEKNDECKFPFEYDGKLVYSCITTSDQNAPWCRTYGGQIKTCNSKYLSTLLERHGSIIEFQQLYWTKKSRYMKISLI